MKDFTQITIHDLLEQCREAVCNGDLVKLGKDHMTDVVTVLAANGEPGTRIADQIREAWRVCCILNSVSENHELFVDTGGVQVAFRCLMTSSDDDDVVLSVLLAIHEVSFTHGTRLISDEYLSRLVQLLSNKKHATSYLSCRILACLLHKGHLDNGVDSIRKEEIMVAMKQTIDRWPSDVTPVVRMKHFKIQAEYLADKHHPVLMYLASWQLNHYTTNDVTLYGYLVFRDLDIAVLEAITRDPDISDVIKELLEGTLCRCRNNGDLAEYINKKAFLGSVIAEAEVCFDKQDKQGLLRIAQQHMPDVLRYLSSTKLDDKNIGKRFTAKSAKSEDNCAGSRNVTSDTRPSLPNDDQPDNSVVYETKMETIGNHNQSAVTKTSDKIKCLKEDRLENGRIMTTDHLDNVSTRDPVCYSETGNLPDNVCKCHQIHTRHEAVGSDRSTLSNKPQSVTTALLTMALPDLWEDAWKICYLITWSCKYNEIFVADGGVLIAQRYLRQVNGTDAMMTYLLGTLYNVFYTDSYCLLQPAVISGLAEQLASRNQDTSFFSCQILANMVSRHHAEWYEDEPSVDTLMEDMMDAIDNWQIDARSDVFNQDMMLDDKDQYLSVNHLPALQYFVSWQLWYSVHQPTVYSARIITDSDLNKMKLLVNSQQTDRRIKAVLSNVIEYYKRIEKSKASLRSILQTVETSWKAKNRKELTSLCEKHLTTLLALLDKDSTAGEEDIIHAVWQIFYYLTWAAASHKYFVDGGCLSLAFVSLKRWLHLEHIAENILLTLYFVARTHAKNFTREDYLSHVLEALDSRCQRISYISCQLLARVLHKLSPTWPTDVRIEKQLTSSMERAIDRWTFDSDLSIYLDVRHVSYLTNISCPVLQYLMAWVMCCCVEKDASKNCTLIVRYVGINLLTDIIQDVMTNHKVKVLLEQVVRSCGERAELAPYINMQRCLQSRDYENPGTDVMRVVLEFLTSTPTTSVPRQLTEHGWQICRDLIRSGQHHQEAFITGNGVNLALDAFWDSDGGDEIWKSIGDILYYIANTRAERLINPDHLDKLIKTLLRPIQMVSYLSCRILCRLVYKGPRHWCLETPTKDDVISRVRSVIEQWRLDYDINIKIDSFVVQREYLTSYQQILQEMAIWEMRHYTRRDTSVYKTLIRDIGLMLLKDVRDNGSLDNTRKTMINHMIEDCESKESLRFYAREKDSLRDIKTKIDKWSRDGGRDRTSLSALGDRYISDVLATLATSQTISLPDDVIDDAWSLCEVFTELPYVNDQLFVNSGGLLIAFKCLQQPSGSLDTVKRILRVLHRAARRHAYAYIRVIYLEKLLDLIHKSDPDISFLSCKLLARILHKGARDWDLVKPTPDDVALQMDEAIDRWSMTSDVGLDHRDQLDLDEMISYLLSGTDQPVLQYFAAWQLCHVMCWNPDKYHQLVRDEIGTESLLDVVNNSSTDDKVKILIQYVIETCQRTESYLEEGGHRVQITFS